MSLIFVVLNEVLNEVEPSIALCVSEVQCGQASQSEHRFVVIKAIWPSA